MLHNLPNIWRAIQNKAPLSEILSNLLLLSICGLKYLSQHPVLEKHQPMLFPQHDTQVSHPHHVTRNIIDPYILIFKVNVGKWKTTDTETRGSKHSTNLNSLEHAIFNC